MPKHYHPLHEDATPSPLAFEELEQAEKQYPGFSMEECKIDKCRVEFVFVYARRSKHEVSAMPIRSLIPH